MFSKHSNSCIYLFDRGLLSWHFKQYDLHAVVYIYISMFDNPVWNHIYRCIDTWSSMDV
jgi:hypothetical protein